MVRVKQGASGKVHKPEHVSTEYRLNSSNLFSFAVVMTVCKTSLQ